MLYDRINSIDITRGIIIILILVLNILYSGHLPLWSESTISAENFNILGGLALPAFIFLYSITVPFALTKKINEGLSGYEISRYIFARALILITIGVLLVNTQRVNAEETGINRFIWTALLVIAVYFVWNRYEEKENNFFTSNGIRLIGLAILVFLVFKFRSGTYENNGSLIPGWWELPGLAGWGFLVTAFTWLAFRNSLTGSAAILIIFLTLNILNYFGYEKFLDPVKPYFGVLITGYIPVISLSGLMTGIMLRKFTARENVTTVTILAISGIALVAVGIILQKFIFNTGIYGNPAWALIESGSIIILFSLVFLTDEVLRLSKPLTFLRLPGINMISAYILLFLLFSLAGLTGINILFFLENDNMLVSIVGSLFWAAIILATQHLLLKFNIRLKF